MLLDFPHGSDSKETACNAGDLGFDPWVGNIPWRREWLPTPVFLSGKFHGQRTLVGSLSLTPPGSPYIIYIIYKIYIYIYVYNSFGTWSVSSVPQSCPTICSTMNRSTPGLPVHHQLPESTQIHVHRVGDAIQPSHPLSSPSPPALNLAQHQGLFQ